VARSIDGTFGRFNEVVYVTSFDAEGTRRPVTRGGRKAVQPGLDGLRFKADEAMNATAGNFVLVKPRDRVWTALILSQAESSLTVSMCRYTGGVSRHPQSP
jgi:hypothetical protein